MQKLHPLPSKKAEKRVIRQLLEAVLFEGLMDYENTAHQPEEPLLSFTVFGNQRTYCCEGRIAAFDRVRLKEDSICSVQSNGSRTATSIEELAEDLVSDPDRRNKLIHELLQTILLSEWNEKYLMPSLSRRTFSYEDLESEVWEGHPYHPCFKARTGFSLEDHAAFGPEAGRSFELQWAAFRREHSQMALPHGEKEFWEKELGPLLFGQLLTELHELGKTFEEYTFLPIHPWQVNHIKDELERGDVVLLKSSGDSYRATQSVRTLWNVANPKKAHLKLSMNMVNTSSLRTLDTHAICAAPHISKWIADTVEADPFLKEEASLIILKEYAGIAYQPTDEETEAKLGAIWRESVRLYMEEGEEAVPFTALPLMERDGSPFIGEWLKYYGIESWLKRLMEVSVVPVWHMLAAHGIAVEAHAQNMILLHKNGWPTRVVLRDFHDSTEYHHDFLAEPSRIPDFGEIHEQFKKGGDNEYYWMNSIEALRELVMDTLFVFHLTELSFALEEQYGYSEKKFWALAGETLAGHMSCYPELIFRNYLLQHTAPMVYAESLLKRKVQKEEAGGFRHLVTNSLA
ncbi:siderophore biosynthesis protein [Paenibacillus sp. FSL R5-0490]|uniref:IucA/IucC family protein n=1 Tax=Paenibacillus sp. FSL R5-0490 TaxID=1920424 RepID=UPI00096C18A9|nr:IucA/IucC family protein [Paenibacillus sp. FSL R5-0490]OMF60366.1 siderophore biosynthesis protein [Paenibacillus sp. FSL R5-0490]